MPIVSTVKETSLQANGGSHVVARYYDQDGKEYMESFFAAAGVEVDTILANRIAGLDEQLAESEFRQIVGI